ncbi:YbaK/EbsC family protein [Cellulomonas cellasea]|uniref:Prolyl-tRNA editing enzyme YbaK/EbsC (Cys-tRNA(Pro) deacylase) n=1 Tax=Cellulomonas cellasea TaxID=43670 RepID=A0A7W4UGP4_9CELL|nr:YbaK/EbsC family protein [Cellulomonas cellasea]MBB2923238.1 prolyl-tRNA editing enzyme YbaK/EbsC (Cys-tRNA(Pro) deacylase) [Cellulomonas cellasea]
MTTPPLPLHPDAVTRTQQFLDEHMAGVQVLVPDADTSTVVAAAAALGVRPGQIAKTLAVRAGDGVLLLVMSGDARLDNRKFRDRFGAKPRMLGAEETEQLTGQPVGGVGPLGHAPELAVYADVSLRAYDAVYPAAGSRSSAVRLTLDQLETLTRATWVDVGALPAVG